jgi:peptidoglycan/LPS O-acetylase OafA/YrhL
MDDRTTSRRVAASNLQRERMLSMVGGVLGLLMFVWGFLTWFQVGDEPDDLEYSGFAFQMPTTAVIGFGLAAGLMALLGQSERRPGRGVPSAIPTALAATGLLLAIGIYIGRDEVSPDLGVDVGVEIGLILALITALLQTVVLAIGLASRYDDGVDDDRLR